MLASEIWSAEFIRTVRYLRGVIGADDGLLPVDGALGVNTRHRLRRGGAAIQLVGLPAGSGQGRVRAGIVADADIGRDPIACEVAKNSQLLERASC